MDAIDLGQAMQISLAHHTLIVIINAICRIYLVPFIQDHQVVLRCICRDDLARGISILLTLHTKN